MWFVRQLRSPGSGLLLPFEHPECRAFSESLAVEPQLPDWFVSARKDRGLAVVSESDLDLPGLWPARRQNQREAPLCAKLVVWVEEQQAPPLLLSQLPSRGSLTKPAAPAPIAMTAEVATCEVGWQQSDAFPPPR